MADPFDALMAEGASLAGGGEAGAPVAESASKRPHAGDEKAPSQQISGDSRMYFLAKKTLPEEAPAQAADGR